MIFGNGLIIPEPINSRMVDLIEVDFAIGVAGMEPSLDYRGATDSYGNRLRVTRMTIVDEAASAAELASGKLKRVPAVMVRGKSSGSLPGTSFFEF